MHDFLSSYLSFENCLHTFCKGHLLRELVFLFEQHQQLWAKDLYDLFLAMRRCVKDRRARDAPLTQAELGRWYKQYRKILRAGRQANPLTPEQTRKKRPQQSKEQNLLDRLEGCEDCILAFLWDWRLPFTNNEAERAFRMMKVRMKISGCFRTLEGARCHARILSYISTLRKHGLPVLEYLRHALDGHPFLPLGSKLGIFGDFSGWVGAEREKAFRVKAVGTV
jgi:transposase